MNQYLINTRNPGRASQKTPSRGLFTEAEYAQVGRSLDAAPVTPLFDLAELARATSLGGIMVKDESQRFGLNAFKTLGVSYAVEQLLERGELKPGDSVACATEGNHGRAVARAARKHGLIARVYVSADAAPARIAALESEGATVIKVPGTYDDAVRLTAKEAQEFGSTIISDTSWAGYESIPRQIMSGYTRMLDEARAQWADLGAPHVVIVQAGVGGLACAVLSWFAYHFGNHRPFIIVCEASEAACVLESARAGRLVTLPGPFQTVMAGLRCGEVSPLAWPTLSDLADAFLAIDDSWALAAVKTLFEPHPPDPPIIAGASGASGLGALIALVSDEALLELRHSADLDSSSRVLVINTEGATDPELFARLVAESQG